MSQGSQGRSFRTWWIAIQCVALFVLAFIICITIPALEDEKKNELGTNFYVDLSIIDESKPIDDQSDGDPSDAKSYNPLNEPLDSVSLVNDQEAKFVLKHSVGSRKCRRPVRSLWTKESEPLKNSSFPSCPVLIDSFLYGVQERRKVLATIAENWTIPEPHDNGSLLEYVKDCDQFRRTADFPETPDSDEEAAYPLAYVITVARNTAQTVRLLRMLYQPQNAYCINYDTRSNDDYKETMLAMASCFSNVYLNPDPQPLYYSKLPFLQSVMSCFDMLRESDVKWRYVQVVSWDDFPLKTNLEMVRIFKTLNGSQDCELMSIDVPQYVAYEHTLNDTPFKYSRIRRPIPPPGVFLYKGSYASSLSRSFIDYLFDDPVSVDLYHYLNGSQFPEEFYWPTLVHNIHLNPPGGFPGQCVLFYGINNEKKPFVSQFQVWQWDGRDKTCDGKIVDLSCVYGVRDLAQLMTRTELMAHKLHEEFQPAALYCLEEWYWQRVCMGDQTDLNFAYYQDLPSVKYHKLSSAEKTKYVCTL